MPGVGASQRLGFLYFSRHAHPEKNSRQVLFSTMNGVETLLIEFAYFLQFSPFVSKPSLKRLFVFSRRGRSDLRHSGQEGGSKGKRRPERDAGKAFKMGGIGG